MVKRLSQTQLIIEAPLSSTVLEKAHDDAPILQVLSSPCDSPGPVGAYRVRNVYDTLYDPAADLGSKRLLRKLSLGMSLTQLWGDYRR